MMQNPCAEIAVTKPEVCQIKSFAQQVVDTFMEGHPSIIVTVASEVELVMVKRDILMAMPVGVMRYCTLTARSYKWDNQTILFTLVGDTLEKKLMNESSTFWTEDACELGRYNPEEDPSVPCPIKWM